MKKVILALSMLTIAFSACKKDDNKDVSAEGKLTKENWKLAKVVLSFPPPIGETDFYANLQACEQDNLTLFVKGGSITLDEGATKCDPADAQTVPNSGTWALNTNDTKLSMDITFGGQELKGNFNIVALTDQALSLSLDSTTIVGKTNIMVGFTR